MDLALVLLACLSALLVFAFARVNLMLLIALGSITTLTGFGIMAAEGSAEWSTFWSFGLCMTALLMGYWLFPDRSHRAGGGESTSARVRTTETHNLQDSAVMGIVVVACTLGIYHLVVGGIPLFSEAIEVERFDFTSSGLLGVPGRMYLYGIPLVWAFTTAVAHFKQVRWVAYKPWVLATFSYVLISVLSGFKSGLLGMLMLMLIFGVVISGKRLLLRHLVLRYWWALSLPLGYGLYVATSYRTYQSSELPIWRQFADRLTLVGAQPKQLAIEHHVYGASPGMVWSDFIYFLTKYSGGDVTGLYSFERAVSAQIIGVNPASSAWTTPVTVGGIPEFIFSFGVPVSVLVFFVTGCLIRFLHRQASDVYSATRACVVLYILYSWITKGGFAYYSLNIVAVALLLALIFAFFNTVSSSLRAQPTSKRRRRSPLKRGNAMPYTTPEAARR